VKIILVQLQNCSEGELTDPNKESKMRINILSSTALITTTIFLMGCQSAQQREFSENTTELSYLDPIQKPQFELGETTQYLDLLNPGSLNHVKVIALSDTGTTFTNSYGCQYTQADDIFEQSSQWNNCNGSGSAVVETQGDIWPLQVGNTVRYNIKGKHNGKSWGGTNICKVASAQNILLGTERYDTFKVVCKRGNKIKTYYMTAGIKQPLIYKYKKEGQNYRHYQYTNPSSS